MACAWVCCPCHHAIPASALTNSSSNTPPNSQAQAGRRGRGGAAAGPPGITFVSGGGAGLAAGGGAGQAAGAAGATPSAAAISAAEPHRAPCCSSIACRRVRSVWGRRTGLRARGKTKTSGAAMRSVAVTGACP
ncbi:MAG: hypothetical protein ACP5ME_15300, partial [Anaerolineae bacterium]